MGPVFQARYDLAFQDLDIEEAIVFLREAVGKNVLKDDPTGEPQLSILSLPSRNASSRPTSLVDLHKARTWHTLWLKYENMNLHWQGYYFAAKLAELLILWCEQSRDVADLDEAIKHLEGAPYALDAAIEGLRKLGQHPSR